MTMTNRVCVAQIVGSHGVHGRVKLKSFMTVPEDVFGFMPLTDETGGRPMTLTMTGSGKDHFLATVAGVKDRNAADALKGTRLFIERAKLPAAEDEDEFYHADLIGLEAVTVTGEVFGTVKALFDFGAGDMVEFALPNGKTIFVPFTKACIPTVDIKAGKLVVDPPENLFASAGPPLTPEQEDEIVEIELDDADGVEGERR